MSTSTQTPVEQRRIATFLSLFKPKKFTVVGHDGMLFLNTLDATLVIGEHDGPPVSLSIKVGSDIGTYVRAAKTGSEIVCRIEGKEFVMDCERVGEVRLSGVIGPVSDKSIFDALGEHHCDISAEDVANAGLIVGRCDYESTRYALSAMSFDGSHMIACDGRRLARFDLQSELPEGETFMVHGMAVKYAAKFGSDIAIFKTHSIVGDLVIKHVEGRYPNWRQVVPDDCDTTLELNVKDVLDAADKQKAKSKVKNGEENGMDLAICEGGTATVDYRYISEPLRGLKRATAKFRQEGIKQGWLTSPLVIESDDRPGWLEVIMPMAREKSPKNKKK